MTKFAITKTEIAETIGRNYPEFQIVKIGPLFWNSYTQSYRFGVEWRRPHWGPEKESNWDYSSAWIDDGKLEVDF